MTKHLSAELICNQIKENLGGGYGQYFGETIMMLAELQLQRKWLSAYVWA